MTPRGGKREGAGRPKELEDAVDVTVRLSAWQLADVKAWQEKHGLGSAAAAVRMMLVAATEGEI